MNLAIRRLTELAQTLRMDIEELFPYFVNQVIYEAYAFVAVGIVFTWVGAGLLIFAEITKTELRGVESVSLLTLIVLGLFALILPHAVQILSPEPYAIAKILELF